MLIPEINDFMLGLLHVIVDASAPGLRPPLSYLPPAPVFFFPPPSYLQFALALPRHAAYEP